MRFAVGHLMHVAAVLPRSIAARLYSIGALTNVTLVALALAAILFVRQNERIVESIEEQGIVAVGEASDVDILLERHRRLIEAAPAQMDRVQIERDRRAASLVAGELRLRIVDSKQPLLRGLEGELDALLADAADVLKLAAAFAQDAAVKAVDDYAVVADRMQAQVLRHRQHSREAATTLAANLVRNGRVLTRWIVAAALLALALVGTLNLFVIRDLVQRIKRITEGMRRVALNETAVSIPSTQDHDEIGEMARALEVFKRNAITLLGHASEIEKLNGWFDIALNNMARGLSMYDADERLIVCNRRYLEMYGIPEALSVPGTPLSAIIAHWSTRAPSEQRRDAMAVWFDKLRASIALGRAFSETHELSGGRTVTTTFQPLDGGGWVDVHEDVTDKRQAEARITQLARFDTLTGLANRHHFHEQLDVALERIGKGSTFALLWLDLDRFKEVNDTLGHPIGDALLKVVAKRLLATVRSADIVARLGGDEFAILQQGADIGEAQVRALAGRLIQSLGEPIQIMGHSVSVGVSIGVALAPTHGTTTDELLKKADIALYRAKADGRGQASFFTGDMEQSLKARRQLEVDLRHAVAHGGLSLAYQPVLDLKARRVVGCEALMRWRHPERGMISPADFIPLAEEVGLIGVMGTWAIRQACRDAVTWPGDVKVAVNLSATQFATTDLYRATVDALHDSRLPPQRLEFEVTEGILLQDNASTLTTLAQLRDLGLAIALDDFGTGYASLSYLRSFPFDKIKIDQSFVRDLPSRDNCVAIVRSVVNLARSLGMKTVAEGVETTGHLEQVSAAGCDQVQGYYFSRPVPANEIVAVLDACRGRLEHAA